MKPRDDVYMLCNIKAGVLALIHVVLLNIQFPKSQYKVNTLTFSQLS